MSQGNFMFPGRMAYIGRVAEEQRDTGLATRVDQLEPVRRAMEYLQLAADNPREDQRDELLSRAYQEARILQAGVTSIQYAIHEHANMIGTELKLDQPLPTLKPEFKPMATERSRPASGDIRTAPIDSNELTMGGFSSARPPGWGQQASPSTDVPQPDLNVKGIDAGMSGGPPRPDTGVNQMFNQVGVPTQFDQPPHGYAGQYKQTNNPPFTEPNETDDGTGPSLAQAGPEEGSGLTDLAMQAEKATAEPETRGPAETQQTDAQQPKRGRGGKSS
jgi:hypothetical protein